MIQHRIHKVLIANRGEIAVRIIRTLRKLNIVSVVIFAEADRHALHVEMAHEAWSLGSGELSDTYLNVEKIIGLAIHSKADAIHPGYGFLSENPVLVEACKQNGIIFIGPDTDSMQLMGNKIAARNFAIQSGLPVTQGVTGSIEEILKSAHRLPFPVLVKAAAGGGGKGMRIVRELDELGPILEATSREAKNYFGDGTVYLEQYIEEPRHIEVQVLGDKHGNVVHLFERECSIQRRYQKIIEESPSPTLTHEVRQKMGEAAVKICLDIGYQSAGTIEFLVDKNLHFYFLEMNTRIQVEHPVTEMVTGIDLIEEQIMIARGFPLRMKQSDIVQTGHAVECRIYAEDPSKGFLPSPGMMTLYHEPESDQLRIDSAINSLQEVHSFYDPMISKLIAWGNTREDAIALAYQSLEKYVIHGISTNIDYLRQMLANRHYQENQISTRFCDDHTAGLIEKIEQDKASIHVTYPVSAFLLFNLNKNKLSGVSNLWEEIGYWRHNMTLQLSCDELPLSIEIHKADTGVLEASMLNTEISASLKSMNKGKLVVFINGQLMDAFVSENNEGDTFVTLSGSTFKLRRSGLLNQFLDYSEADSGHDKGNLFAPMPGKVIKVNVKEGDKVVRGTILMVVEAMKMENNIVAPSPAIVEKINVKEGDMVDSKTQLIHLSENE